MPQADICELLIRRGAYMPTITAQVIADETRRALQVGGPPTRRALADGRVLSVCYRPMPGGGWVSTFLDVTEQQRSDERLAHLAHHDVLTGLPNRHALQVRYGELAKAVDPLRPLVALCYIDLHRFKVVNDTFGHDAGDALLRSVADRLRTLSAQDDLLARLAGDEFAIVRRVATTVAAEDLARKVVEALSQPYDLASGRHNVGAIAGVATRDGRDGDLAPLLLEADLALRSAKTEGRGTVTVFNLAMSNAVRARRSLETELHTALSEQQFELHYQPVVDANARSVVAAEALVRWRHPQRGLVPPDAFIPLMEEAGLIVPLGRWVLDRACRDARHWPDHVSVAVNVSSVQLRQRDFCDTFLSTLSTTGLGPHRLEIEITESSLLDDSDLTREALRRLHGAGVRIAMDDFGTGYSSLSYLRRFPIDKIKIDRSFMKDADTNEDARAIIRAVSALGASLGVTTLVEGVETSVQFNLACAEGVQQIQGYLISRPQPEPIASRLIRSPIQTAIPPSPVTNRRLQSVGAPSPRSARRKL